MIIEILRRPKFCTFRSMSAFKPRNIVLKDKIIDCVQYWILALQNSKATGSYFSFNNWHNT